MFSNILSFSLMATSAMALQALSPVQGFGAMYPRGNGLAKRQGYYPDSSTCGIGDTCLEACGTSYSDCPADNYCIQPALGQHCCPTGLGCDEGYTCTTDGADNTFCCPDGMDLTECAAAYSLTVSLFIPTETPSAPVSVAEPTTTSVEDSTTILETSTVIETSSFVDVTSIPAISLPAAPTVPTGSLTAVLPSSNATLTGSNPPQFTGAAAKVAGVAMAALGAAAGVAGLL